ncbi:MAG: hypothetical protein RLZZ342_172 [Candidatus Parcubacteria bacterium]|jgi:hypothetical protein
MIGAVTTDCGERVVLSIARLAVLGFKRPPEIGDRIHFWARRKVEVTYQITEVRIIVPADSFKGDF